MAHVISLKRHGACGSIILDRPEKKNALNRELLLELRQGVQDFQQQKSVRAIVLMSSSDVFCAGLDLHEMHETSKEEQPFGQWGEDAQLYRSVLNTILDCPKPIIAAVNGPALGAGAVLVLACDIVLASKQATLGFPEPRRGIVSGLASPLLQFRLGGSRASYLLTTCEPIEAERALQWGAFHELLDDTLLWARGNELANQVALSSQEAVQLTKKMLNETVGEHLRTQLASGAAASATARTTEAAEEGIAAFVQKRPPTWP
jgi:enoyl-CoA hydratase/carnithine racemase